MKLAPPLFSAPRPWLAVGFGLLVFALLSARFSPDWLEFARTARTAFAEASSPRGREAVEAAILSGHSERGLHVLRLSRDPAAEIADPVHRIVRWRLLPTLPARWLNLPPWVILGLAHAGCLLLAIHLAWLGLSAAAAAGAPVREGFGLAVVAGATAPFFTSMGWLGYYDSLLALGLLAVAFSRSRVIVVLACLTTPWIDERFVLGLPLTLGVRYLIHGLLATDGRRWVARELLPPLVLGGLYTLVRLSLGGTGGAQTLGEYLREFVLGQAPDPLGRLQGAWAGLRLGWLLVALAVAGVTLTPGAGRKPAVALALGACGTAWVGLLSALDLSRAMVLLLPLLPLGWGYALRFAFWRRWQIGPGIAALSLALPAHHVIAQTTLPVDHPWDWSLPLLTAESNLGELYLSGEQVARDHVRARRWLERAALQGSAAAQYNLGLIYAKGLGVPRHGEQAVHWFTRSAEQGTGAAMETLGVILAAGEIVPRDVVKAHGWFNLSQAAGRPAAREKLDALARTMTAEERRRAVEWARARRDWAERRPYGILHSQDQASGTR